jgi:glucose/mannose-6-phosphate isomerase
MSASPPQGSLMHLAWMLPDHLALGFEAGRNLVGLPVRGDMRNIVVLGMGSAATAGRLVRALAAGSIPVPLSVESSYTVPAWVGEGSLVFALSGSGNTDEVNHAAARAAALGARLVVVSGKGWLIDFACLRAAPAVIIPAEITPPRAAFGMIATALLGALGKIGFLPGIHDTIASAIAQTRRRREELIGPDSLAVQIADHLAGRHVLVQGDSPLGAVAAERWKAQINQGARQPASSSEQPNASHGEVVAWDSQSGTPSPGEAVMLLRHGYEDPRVARRMDLFAAHLDGKVQVDSVRGEGDTPLAALMDLVMIGDVTALCLAERNGVDPASAPFVSTVLKAGLKPPQVAVPKTHG